MCSSCNCKKDAEEFMDEPLVSLNEEYESEHEESFDLHNNTEGEK